jgi:hypothetical protein
MLVSKAVTIFDVLSDKYGSPNVIPSETIDHLNMATAEYLNRVFPDTQGGVANFEADQLVTANLQPLIYPLGVLNMDANGRISTAAINSALEAVTAAGTTYFRIGNVGTGSIPIRYVKHNNIWAYKKNTYKAPSTTNPFFTIVGAGLQFYPTSTVLPISITVIRNPAVLGTHDIDEGTEMEFGDYVTYNIISIALKLAGIATRDTELIEDARLAGLQINQ